MEVFSTRLRRFLALTAVVAGLLLAWLAFEPSGLLVVVVAMCIWLGWHAGLASIAVASLFWSGILLSRLPFGPEAMTRMALFIGAAGAIWILIQVFRTYNLSDMIDQDSQRLVADIPGLGWTAYPNGKIRFINPAVLAFVGITPAELLKLMETEENPLERWTHPDDRERNRLNWERALKTGEPLVDEQRALRYDGVYRWFRDTVVPARDKRGRITGWYGHTTDITEQKAAEEALRQSERELRLLIDTVPTMIFVTTIEGRPYYFNKRFADWIGVDPGGTPVLIVNGQDPYLELIHPDDRISTSTAVYEAFAGGNAIQYKTRLRHSSGQYRWLDSRIEPLRDENGAIIRWYGVNIDIDDEVRAQEALRLADDRLARASRAASMAELSVSIAHELNSPLQAVVSNANAFQRWLSADPPNYDRAASTADRIIRDANAAAEVINRIRSLFAQNAQGRGLVNLNAVITEVCDLIADKLQSGNVRLELNLDPTLASVRADSVQIEQVVLNLARNGIEAMAEVDTSLRMLQVFSRRRADDMLEVEIRDHGTGISNPDRIFDAFYTTKKDGLGMGLAICRSIIEAHKGHISASGLPEGGTSVSFTLPNRQIDNRDPLEGNTWIGQ
jgi:PAS domain S-box-containing protein